MNVSVEIVASLTLEQIAQLTDILRDSMTNDEGISVDKKEIVTYYRDVARELEEGKRVMAIAHKGYIIIGSMLAKFYPGDYVRHLAYFEKLLVKPDFRRQGVARQLLVALEKKMKELGKERIELSFRKGNPGEGVYLQQGFRVWGVAKKETKIGTQYFDEVYMEKLL